jgi:hypothetical protein
MEDREGVVDKKEVNMTDELFKFQLENLQKLHVDLEKQMQNFDEVVPYERQRTAQIYSPRLLNMMLVCGSHIEAITRLIRTRCGFPDGGIPTLIGKINEKAVLSNFRIISIPHQIQFTPFTQTLGWWDAYNELKHDLVDKSHKITYTIVMDTFAALAALHCLSDKLNACSDKDIPVILDAKNWTIEERSLRVMMVPTDNMHRTPSFWHSLLFEVRALYHIW